MQQSTPIIICEKNPDFRILLKDIFTRNGYFHILETSSPEDVIKEGSKNSQLISLINEEFFSDVISYKKNLNLYLYCHKSSGKLSFYAATLGIDKILTYPLSSKKLISKILG